ncbi:MAG TPA: hypothetical protein VHO25_01340, partial [Polyangiaceae bacterium]|nr:hypothetical protein [Polyangiaceae bacterium]
MRTTTGPLARRVLALGLTAYLSLSCGAGSRQSAESASHTGSKREPRAFGLTLVIPNMRRDWSGIVSLFPDTEEHQPIRRIPLDVLLPGLVGAGLAPHLLLDRPVYAFMFSEENPPPGAGSALLSVGLDDCSATLADLPEDQYRTFSTKNGVTTFEPLPETAALFEKDSRCEVWSLPKGKCRLLCGQRVDLESQPTERLVATVPPAGHDGDWFYASFNLPQLKKEAFATLPEPRNAAQRLGQGLSIDAMNDLGNVGMGLSAGPKDVRLRLDLEFASSHALISDTVLGRAVEERVEEAFFDLPEESLFALRLSGMERGKRRDDVRTLLSRLLDLSGEQASPEEREEMLTAAGKLIFAGGPSIWAWGFDFQRARSELLNFFRRQGDESSRTQQLARAWRPWVVFGFVESDGAAWLAELDRAISASGVTPVSDKTAAQAKPDAQDDTTASTSFRRPAPSGAPKGTRYFVS